MPKTSTSNWLSQFIQLEKDARNAKSIVDLSFIICNRSKQLIDYHQAVFWRWDLKKQIKIQAISGVSKVNDTAPYLSWLRGIFSHLLKSKAQTIAITTKKDIPRDYQRTWHEWMPQYGLWCPFQNADGELIGGLWLSRATKWQASEINIVNQLNDNYQHAFAALLAQKQRRIGSWLSHRPKRKAWMILAGVLLFLLFPVRQSVLAPAEIAAKNPMVISSPLKGVIKHIDVEPNQTVKPGQLLFNLDPTDFENRYQLALNQLRVAKEKYRKAAQHGFNNPESKWQLAILKTEIDKTQLDAQYNKTMLNRVNVKAPTPGIAIFADKNDWLGKPTIIGERVMLIANPKQKELDIFMPVTDAISIQPGNKVRLFLNVRPLHPVYATIRYASYSAEPEADGTLNYRLKAVFDKDQDIPRIGLHGTAKVYGQYVPMAYYLFWRPLSTLRRTLGI